MAKLTLNDITGGYQTADAYNVNNALIEAALENTLSRDGTTPNQMGADLDMNSYDLNNVIDLNMTGTLVNTGTVSVGALIIDGTVVTVIEDAATVAAAPDATQVTYTGTNPVAAATTLQDALDDDYMRIAQDNWDQLNITNIANETLMSIVSSRTNGSVISITADDLTSGYAIDIDLGDTGNLGAGGGLRILGPTVGGIGAGTALMYAVSNSNVPAVAGFANGTGVGSHAITAYSNISARSSALVLLNNENGGSAVPALEIKQDDPSVPSILLNGGLSGIKFAGAVVSTDANTLDYYQEGTWDPVLFDTSFSDAEGQVYTTQEGAYTRIGNIVWVSGRIQMSSLGTLTTGSVAYVGGLPFTSSTSYYSALCVAEYSGLNLVGTTDPGILMQVEKGTQHARVLHSGSAGASGSLAISEVSSNGRLVFSGWYRV